MSVTTTTHVNFRGQAREALDFYQSVFGGEISIATHADIHAVEEPAQADNVAFGRVDAPNGFTIMAYDVQPSKGYDPGENPFYITRREPRATRSNRSGTRSPTRRPRSSSRSPPPPSLPSTACSPTATASPGSSAPTPPGKPTDRAAGGVATRAWRQAVCASCGTPPGVITASASPT